MASSSSVHHIRTLTEFDAGEALELHSEVAAVL
jgi:hypothetical protein